MIILFLDFKLSLTPNMELRQLLLRYQSRIIPIHLEDMVYLLSKIVIRTKSC